MITLIITWLISYILSRSLDIIHHKNVCTGNTKPNCLVGSHKHNKVATCTRNLYNSEIQNRVGHPCWWRKWPVALVDRLPTGTSYYWVAEVTRTRGRSHRQNDFLLLIFRSHMYKLPTSCVFMITYYTIWFSVHVFRMYFCQVKTSRYMHLILGVLSVVFWSYFKN